MQAIEASLVLNFGSARRKKGREEKNKECRVTDLEV
jgi:hypothetical protein